MKKVLLSSLVSCLSLIVTAQVSDTIVLKVNHFVRIQSCCGMPEVIEDSINAISLAGFKNIMDYNAVGNGTTDDYNAIKAAVTAADAGTANAQGWRGIIIPSGRTFLTSKLLQFTLHHNFIVYAVGSTIKAQALSRYSFFSLDFPQDSQTFDGLWIGGTIDGNQTFEKWGGNPRGGIYDVATTTVEAHGRFAGWTSARFGLFYKVKCINMVMDGIACEATLLGVISDCTSENSARVNYAESGQQNTDFKARWYIATKDRGNTIYFLKDSAFGGGGMGIQVSYPQQSTMDNSTITVVAYCYVNNIGQNSLHFEDTRKAILYASYFGQDTTLSVTPSVHVSNRTEAFAMIKCNIRNVWLNLNNAPELRVGLVRRSTFISEFSGNQLPELIHNVTHVYGNTFSGKVSQDQVFAKYARKNVFTNFGSKKALTGVINAEGNTFQTGTTSPVSTVNGGKVYADNLFVNCPTNVVTAIPLDNSHVLPFQTLIRIEDNTGKFIRNITAGY